MEVPFIPKPKLERLPANFESIAGRFPLTSDRLQPMSRKPNKIAPSEGHFFSPYN
jgi:hypothetical protein